MCDIGVGAAIFLIKTLLWFPDVSLLLLSDYGFATSEGSITSLLLFSDYGFATSPFTFRPLWEPTSRSIFARELRSLARKTFNLKGHQSGINRTIPGNQIGFPVVSDRADRPGRSPVGS